MDLRESDADRTFRAELLAWLDSHAPDPEVRAADPPRSSADLRPWARTWQRKLFDDGWLVPGWPPELGGRNATPTQQMIYFEEFSRARLQRSTNPQGLGIVAPSINDYGSAAQREAFVLPTLRAEIAWCIGMSEPDAGSDLAGLQTAAVLDGDEFVVNGQKVWTSGAHHADWCLLFVRTNPDAPKHKGISVVIVDMESPGLETRPFAELTDPERTDFNEVFLSDVRVPAENLLGEIDKGWPIAGGSLAHERAMLWINYAYDLQRGAEALRDLGRRPAPHGGLIADDSRFADRVADAYIDATAMLALGYRGFSKFLAGKSSPEHSLLKLFGGEAVQRVCLDGVEALGPAAVDSSLPGFELLRTGSWETQYLSSFGGTIPGGTSEIQRNIIAERVLGLPR
ncbi:MAG: acyl-CoA dehydrogenase family protein [Acidimicrobiia bacterium]